jgi:hypothetical protein
MAKPKLCKVCKREFKPMQITPVCSYICALKLNQQKEAKKEAKEWKLTRKGMQDKLKTLSDYEKEAKTEFQRFIRLRDSELPCISCRKMNCKDWAGGHYFSAGQYSGLMFEETNCHKQCNTYCNKFQSGNLLEYRNGLLARFGAEYVKDLEAKANTHRNYKYTKDELIEIKQYYKDKCKEYGND